MKILDWYIIREHIAPFLFSFFTITFLLVIEYVPKIVNHVIDKDLSIWVVLELVALNLAWMLALSVPMSILVAVLIAFGRLASDFEIVAIKASGINVFRLMVPVLLVGCLFTYGMVVFNDKILPDLNKTARQLWSDISAMRPTLVFKSGVFITDIPNYLVLIDKIDHATSRVEGISITDDKDRNYQRIIVAEYGYLKMTDDGKNMQFTLHNGQIHTLDVAEPENYRKINFETQVINVKDVSSELRRSESNYRSDREMGIDQMSQIVKSSLSSMIPIEKSLAEFMNKTFSPLFSDSISSTESDTLSDSSLIVLAKHRLETSAKHIQRQVKQLSSHQRNMNKYKIEIYKKYSIPAAAIAFILIGAPLAVMSKRGGMGISISISILLFIIYWSFLIGGEDLADRGLVDPFWAMWSANILIGGIGVILTLMVSSEFSLASYFNKKVENKA